MSDPALPRPFSSSLAILSKFRMNLWACLLSILVLFPACRGMRSAGLLSEKGLGLAPPGPTLGSQAERLTFTTHNTVTISTTAIEGDTSGDYFGLDDGNTITYKSGKETLEFTSTLLNAATNKFRVEGVSSSETTQEYYTRKTSTLELSRVVHSQGKSLDLSFSPAVVILQEPITKGLTWSDTAAVSGTSNGTEVTGTLDYTVQVGPQKSIKIALGKFLAYKITSTFDLSVNLERTTRPTRLKVKSVDWFVPYLGSIKSVSSGKTATMTDYSPR